MHYLTNFMIRLILADDHNLFRRALRMTLEAYDNMIIVAEVTNGVDVISAVDEYQPDIVCMDINMPRLNGVLATRQLQLLHPEVKIIALSSNADLFLVGKMLHAGALAYVDKASAGTELIEAISFVEKNQLYLSPTLGIRDVKEMQQYLQFSDLEQKE